MKTGSRPNLERENPVICEKSGGDAVKLKTFLITASLWMGLLGLTACGGADVRTYQYPETALLFDSLHIGETSFLLCGNSSSCLWRCKWHVGCLFS